MRSRIWSIAALLLTTSVFAGNPVDGLDLPVPNPRNQKEPASPPKPPDPHWEIEDPTDLPPIFYGEEISLESGSIVFVIDGSGSMVYPADRSLYKSWNPNVDSRWDVVKRELKRAVDGLAENLKFNLIKYACDITFCFDDLREANPGNKAAAKGWLDHFVETRTGSDGIYGGTGTGPAVAAALGYKENLNIVLLTDGEPNCPWGLDSFNEHRRAILINNTQGATIDVFGVVASGQHRAFCQAVAADSGGNYYDR